MEPPRWLRPLLAICAFFACLAGARSAGATGYHCFACSLWMPVGINVGAAIHPGSGTGVLVGGELGVLDLRYPSHAAAFGGYADALYDRESRSFRLGVGPEMVLCPGVGLDAGLLFEGASGGSWLGARVRYFAAFPFVSPYIGETFAFARGHGAPATEIGVLLKYPFELLRAESDGPE
jgi:hypothetical protein